MLKKLHDQVNRIFTWLKRNQTIKTRDGVVMVNLGSGLTVADGWYNIDGHLRSFFASWPRWVLKLVYRNVQKSNLVYSEESYISILKNHTYIYHNLKYGIPFANDSVDFLYASHFLEHLFPVHAALFLKEAYRCLKKKGMIRICVPDLAYVIKLYQQGEKKKALGYFYEDSPADEYTYHRYLYDAELLKEALEAAGFRDVQKCSYQKGQTPDIQKLDRLPEETLYMEAIK